MFNVTRRQALAASGGFRRSHACAHSALPARPATRSPSPTTSTCRPSIPTVGPSAVNPTIQAIYRSVFDQYIGQKPTSRSSPAC